MVNYSFNDTQIMKFKPFGKIAFELYNEKRELIEHGNLGDFDKLSFKIEKLVKENYTLTLKVHFKIEVIKIGAEEIKVEVKPSIILKSTKGVFKLVKK